MATSIPDFWGDDIRVDVLTPVVILRAQVERLEKKTKGILKATVSTTTSENRQEHHFDLTAPLLNPYRERLLSASHDRDRVYPVVVTAAAFAEKPRGPIPKSSHLAKMLAGGLSDYEKQAATQEEFMDLVRRVLQSPDVRSLTQSLIARSNEIAPPAESADASPTDSGQPPTKPPEPN